MPKPVMIVGFLVSLWTGIALHAEEHWALQPIRAVDPPQVQAKAWSRTRIDRFILAKLEAANLRPTPEADQRTLLRRAYVDLIGLPPTAAEVRQFENNPSPTAYEAMLERLLARPEYGERWARHWLDVARYADTPGYEEGSVGTYPFAFTYRDYVIRSLNEDPSFKQLIREQLAADQLALDEKAAWKLAAMGFLTLGPRFNHSRHEIIDDRIDVLSRGFMGLTIACARCHDHKFDPIPTDDYYGLYGIFASSSEPNYAALPKVGSWQGSFKRYRAFRNQLRERQVKLEVFQKRMHRRIRQQMLEQLGDYLHYLVIADPRHAADSLEAVQDLRRALRGPTPYGPGVIVNWEHRIAANGTSDPIFGAWNALVQLPQTEFARKAAITLDKLTTGNRLVLEKLRGRPLTSMVEVAEVYADLLNRAEGRWQQWRKANPEATQLPNPAWESLRQVLYASDSPLVFDIDTARDYYTDEEFNQYMARKRQLNELFLNYADVAAPRAMVLQDRSNPANAQVFARGNPERPVREAPRHFPEALAHVSRKAFTHGSGRLELAEAIASDHNPLTPRVIVNRVWRWHFGRGLVETTSDFGMRGETPSHPKLLDDLAARFVANGWSLKWLHREIMTSATYRQASRRTSAATDPDPDNRLLSRMRPRRLGFEALRDAILLVSGQLDRTIGGQGIEAFDQPRRSLYLHIDRQDLPAVRRAFDFPSADLSAARRSETTTPQQALFFLNSPFVQRAVENILEQLDANQLENRSDVIVALYEQILSRPPKQEERIAAQNYLENVPKNGLTDLAHALLASNEFMFVD